MKGSPQKPSVHEPCSSAAEKSAFGPSWSRRNLICSVAAFGGTFALGCQHDESPKALTLYAASSLKNVMAFAIAQFERQHPKTKIRAQFAGTGQLLTQIHHGARPDFLAAADESYLERLDPRLYVDSVPILENSLALVLHPASASRVTRLEQLPKVGRLVLGAEQVPVGRYALRFLRRAEQKFGPGFEKRVQKRVISYELNVKRVLSKVILGEADAGIVYQTDAKSAHGQVRTLAIDPALNVTCRYPWVRMKSTVHRDEADAFSRFIRSEETGLLFEEFGFERPFGGIDS